MISDADLLWMIDHGRLRVDMKRGLVFSPRSNNPDVPLGCVTPKGYLRCKLYWQGQSHGVFVHRIVCIAKYGLPPEPHYMPNHGNHNKSDNRPQNLEWVTNQENVVHAVAAGRIKHARGERQWKAKLTASKVRSIRRRFNRHPGLSKAAIGREFGISGSQIANILQRKTWKHI